MTSEINIPEYTEPGKANTMKLTILGATGATGTCLTSQALAAGHEVTAVVRDPARLAVAAHPRLRTVTADVMDPASIAPAIAGADAVISAVGPRGTAPRTAEPRDQGVAAGAGRPAVAAQPQRRRTPRSQGR